MEKLYQDGDILVFKAGNHWLSQTIALLTHSDVSHAAMIYGDHTLVEMELPGIQLTDFEAEIGEGAHLMRLNVPRDPQPLIDAANVYLNANTRYDLPALVLLAGLLLYSNIRPTVKYVAIADEILKAAVKKLDCLIDKIIYDKPGKAMVCSQLVNQIYYDCGEDYRIQLENSVLFPPLSNEESFSSTGELRLIDIIRSGKVHIMTAEYDGSEIPEETPTDEELGLSLIQVLRDLNQDDVSDSPADDINPLLSSGKLFLDALEKLLEKAMTDIPLDSLFVMPADLAYHAKNLDQIALLHIVKHNT